jgi:Na+/alanine symporter
MLHRTQNCCIFFFFFFTFSSLECSGFTLQMALMVDTTYIHSPPPPNFVALVLMQLGLLVMFAAQVSTFFSVLVPRMCVLYHNFYCRLSCYLPHN